MTTDTETDSVLFIQMVMLTPAVESQCPVESLEAVYMSSCLCVTLTLLISVTVDVTSLLCITYSASHSDRRDYIGLLRDI